MSEPILFSPVSVRGLTARNRLWLPPMCMYSAGSDGVATDWHVHHYGARAFGGFGVVVAEATAVSPEGRISPRDLGLWDDRQVEAYARIVDAIHAGGALAGVQIGHAGRKGGTAPNLPGLSTDWDGTRAGWNPVAPSAIAFPGLAVPDALDEPGIERVVAAFVSAARRAGEAGADLVEIHGAHGYLLHEFLSPLTNHRTDRYGGTREGRERILLRVVEGARAALGDSRILGVRLSATDWAEGGLTSQDTCRLSKLLVECGVDVIHVSTGGNVPAEIPVGPGYQLPYAADVSRAVAGSGAQVVGVGLIANAARAEDAVASAACDAVAVGRPALNDPYLPVRWAHDLAAETSPAQPQYWRGTWAD